MKARKFPDWLEAYTKYTENSEPPRIFKIWVGISTIAAALQRKCYLKWDKLTYPNLYIVLTAPSGKARKGSAMYPAEDLLRSLGVNLAAEAITREALIRELKESAVSGIDPRTNTPKIHCSITVFSKELTVFIGGQHNEQLLSDLTDWFDCAERWKYRTKTQGTDLITGVWVNLIGATTPALLQTMLPSTAIGGGLTSRMIFVYEDRKSKLVPRPQLTEDQIQMRKDLLDDLEQISMMEGEFSFSEEFLTFWDRWYLNQNTPANLEDPRFSGYVERRPHHLLKLAMILCASRTDSMVIDELDVTIALGLLQETEKQMHFAFSGVGKSPIADVLTSVSATIARKGTTSIGELLRIHYYDADKDTMMKVVETLASMGFCKIAYTAKGAVQITYSREDE